MKTARHVSALERPAATHGRVALYFAARYATSPLVLLALAVSGVTVRSNQLSIVLTVQAVTALLTHALAMRSAEMLGLAVWIGMVTDIAAIGTLVGMTGGAGGPLVFLFTVHALAAGILLSSRAGFRALLLSTLALAGVDVIGAQLSPGADGFPRALEAVAALWIIGGGGALFSTYNERELRRRNAELGTIRKVTLDIEDSLSLEEIFADLCGGVVQGFAFDAAAVLLRDGDVMRCAGSHGVTGMVSEPVPVRGRVAHALALSAPLVTSTEQARGDGALIPLLGDRGYLAIPIVEDGLLIVTRSGRKGRPGTIRGYEIDGLDRLAHHARLAIGNARLHARVSEMALTDPLTGLANHGEFQRRLAFEVGRLQRYAPLKAAGHRSSLVILDIDHFKRFNDKHGHPAGDAVLKGVAAAVRGAVRSFDIVARYGGEEFCVILPETGEAGSRDAAERIRKSVAQYPFAVPDGKPVRVTVSVGVATAPENGATPAALVKAADAALYRSKENGRNRVTHAADEPDPVAKVLPLAATRRRREPAAAPARAGSRRAPAASSLPKRRTPPS